MTDDKNPRKGRRTLVGRVLSAKMKDTCVVMEERLVKHALYGKYMRRKSKYAVHDPGNVAKEGDDVEIMQTRPISKTKTWRLVRVVTRSHGEVLHADVDVAAVQPAPQTGKGEPAEVKP
jgi:small subunit ribosomal protein S17